MYYGLYSPVISHLMSTNIGHPGYKILPISLLAPARSRSVAAAAQERSRELASLKAEIERDERRAALRRRVR